MEEDATAARDHVGMEELLGVGPGDRLSPAARAHLESCRRCRRRRDEVEALAADMRTDRDREPSPGVVHRAVRLLPRRPSLVQRIAETIGRLVPTPALDSLAAEPVRGRDAVTALRFEGQGLQVTCQLSCNGSGRLVGQVAPADGAPIPLLASIVTRGRTRREVPVSEHGLFVIDGLPELPFDLLLADTDRRLRLAVERTEPAGTRSAREPARRGGRSASSTARKGVS